MAADQGTHDWRAPLLASLSLRAAEGPAAPSVTWAPAELGGHEVVVASWDFTVAGGSLGERDASSWVDATTYAVQTARPVVALVRSGGTRVTEGVGALVGMARATLARQRLADAGVPLIAVADQPTTGGVFTTIVSRADVRCAVAGATVGFAGPRVVQAVTGTLPTAPGHTAAGAATAGIVDAEVAPGDVHAWVCAVLEALSGRTEPPAAPAGDAVARPLPATGTGWEAVLAARSVPRPDGADLLRRLLSGAVPLTAARGDSSCAAVLGQVAGGAAVGVALAAVRGGRPTPDGFRLLGRSARLADRLDLPLLTLVDTPGAEPGPAAEADGLAGTIAEAMAAVLACRSPTVGVLVGEGGSGGALAGLVCDRVLACPSSYFAALVPEGAAVALKTTPEDAAERMDLRPADILALGVLDALVPEAADPAFEVAVGAALASLAQRGDARRRATRMARWSAPAPGKPRRLVAVAVSVRGSAEP